MDTACSSALMAVLMPRANTSGLDAVMLVLAGGVTVMISPGGFIGFSQVAAASPEGRRAAFDASASGSAAAKAPGMVLLKRLSLVLADGDRIQGSNT